MNPVLDWHGVLSGQPLQWIISGFLTTVWVSLAGMILATVLAVLLLALRLGGGRAGRGLVACWVSLFRNTAAAGTAAVLVFRCLEPAAADGAGFHQCRPRLVHSAG
ncbi:amino ABC transporter, permease protein, 3-TM region, His/Glu/Gln/Arg/opine family [Raoultella ornithinolytica]|nr:amino ABC transporter, permease protein, 3-TM region, His/Glu/Gln/Arg/opine family [Raoultella ornithinolytica]